jgi:hypothetical protein
MNRQVNTAEVASTNRGYSTSYTVEQAPAEVFAAILNVPAWWTGQVEGTSDGIGAEFSYRHPPQHYSRQRVTELEFARRVVWEVVDSELGFISEPAEWTGSEIIFEITAVHDGTKLGFTHVGLMPDVECYDACSAAWIHYINGSLHSLITTGAGLPDPW